MFSVIDLNLTKFLALYSLRFIKLISSFTNRAVLFILVVPLSICVNYCLWIWLLLSLYPSFCSDCCFCCCGDKHESFWGCILSWSHVSKLIKMASHTRHCFKQCSPHLLKDLLESFLIAWWRISVLCKWDVYLRCFRVL